MGILACAATAMTAWAVSAQALECTFRLGEPSESGVTPHGLMAAYTPAYLTAPAPAALPTLTWPRLALLPGETPGGARAEGTATQTGPDRTERREPLQQSPEHRWDGPARMVTDAPLYE